MKNSEWKSQPTLAETTLLAMERPRKRVVDFVPRQVEVKSNGKRIRYDGILEAKKFADHVRSARKYFVSSEALPSSISSVDEFVGQVADARLPSDPMWIEWGIPSGSSDALRVGYLLSNFWRDTTRFGGPMPHLNHRLTGTPILPAEDAWLATCVHELDTISKLLVMPVALSVHPSLEPHRTLKFEPISKNEIAGVAGDHRHTGDQKQFVNPPSVRESKLLKAAISSWQSYASSWMSHQRAGRWESLCASGMAGDLQVLVGLLAMLNSNGLEISDAFDCPEGSPQKARFRGGSPLPNEHKILTLSLPKNNRASHRWSEGENDSPCVREHSVRGHWRMCLSGKKTWVREHRRGDPSLGIITKDYLISEISEGLK